MESTRLARPAAYLAALFFAVHLLTYFIPAVRDATLAQATGLAIAVGVLAIVQHVVVFPVVATLAAPQWARFAGYTWLVIDMGTDLLQLGGTPKPIYLGIRLAINVVAAVWIATAALNARGAIRGIGVFVAIDSACYSLLGLLVPWAFVITLPSLVLLPLWFVLIGRHFRHTMPSILPS